MNFHFESWEFWNVLKLWDTNGKGKPCVIQKLFVPLESFFKFRFWKWTRILHFELKSKELWSREEGPKTKPTVWFPTNKTQEIKVKWPLMKACNIILEGSCWWLQLWSWNLLNWNSHEKVKSSQTCETQNLGISKLLWGIKKSFQNSFQKKV